MKSYIARSLCLFASTSVLTVLGFGCAAIEDEPSQESPVADEGAPGDNAVADGGAIENDPVNTRSLLDGLLGYTAYLSTKDLNKDKAPDLVAMNILGNNLAVRLNNGDGTFGAVSRYPVGITPALFISAHFDDKEHFDQAVVNLVSNNVSVLLGNGDGTFQPTVHYSVADPVHGQLAAVPFAVATGDFDHDGAEDIATANTGSTNISILLGKGDGTFRSPKVYPLTGQKSVGLVPFPLVAIDLDKDGDLDLLSGGADGIVTMRGHGDGSFTAVGHQHAGLVLSCMQIADFNGDGEPDIGTTAIGSSNYSILLGNGDGTFDLKESKWSGGIAGECYGIGDLNGDYKLDLAIANTSTLLVKGNVAVLLGRGDGTFKNPVRHLVGLTPWDARIVDLDADGAMDIAVANGGNTSVSIMFGNGDGTLQPQIMYPM